jgi:esterase/lipase superfamily enzyme
VTGSSEELAELKAGYLQYEGDLDYVIANTLCCGNDEDMVRHQRTLSQLIEDKELPTFFNFQNFTTRSGRNQVIETL